MKLRPKKYGGYKDKGKENNVVIVLQDVGFDSGDGSKVLAIGIQGKDKVMSLSHHANTSASMHLLLVKMIRNEVNSFMFGSF